MSDDIHIPTPGEVRAFIENDAAFLERCVAALGKARTLDDPITVSTHGAAHASVMSAIEKLRSRGWAARYVGDLRDGSYVEIKPS